MLRPLFPYEFEIPAGPSMYPGSGGHSRTGSPPLSCPVRRIRRQDPLHTTGWKSLTNGWYTIIPKDKVKAESLLITEHISHTSMCMNNASLFLAYQSINWRQNSVHILLKLNDDSLFITYISYTASDNLWYNIQSVQYVICVMIVRGLWYIGLAIRYTIWIVVYLCTSWGTFLRINGETTLSPLDATAAHRWRCSSCQS